MAESIESKAEIAEANPPFYWTICTLLSYFFRLYNRASFRNGKKAPQSGPMLVVSNHQSVFDPPLIAAAIPRRLRFFAKAELFRSRLFGWTIRNLGAFPVNRGGADRKAIGTSIKLLKLGEAVVLFPEGTRTKTGEVQPFLSGAGMIAASAPDVQILPVRIHGAYGAFKTGQKLPSPVKIKVVVGDPFYLSDLKDLPTEKKALYQAVSDEMLKRILSL